MHGGSFLPLVYNAALLLAMAFLYDVATTRWPIGRARPQSSLSQLAQVLLMSNEFMFED